MGCLLRARDRETAGDLSPCRSLMAVATPTLITNIRDTFCTYVFRITPCTAPGQCLTSQMAGSVNPYSCSYWETCCSPLKAPGNGPLPARDSEVSLKTRLFALFCLSIGVFEISPMGLAHSITQLEHKILCFPRSWHCLTPQRAD